MSVHAQPRVAFSINEVSKATGLSRSLIYDLMNSGQLGFIKVGRRRIITATQLDAFLSGNTVAA
jgi:excisionase family DNA binding protein